MKIGKETDEQKKVINIILKNFTILEKKLVTFLETILKCYLMLITMLKR